MTLKTETHPTIDHKVNRIYHQHHHHHHHHLHHVLDHHHLHIHNQTVFSGHVLSQQQVSGPASRQTNGQDQYHRQPTGLLAAIRDSPINSSDDGGDDSGDENLTPTQTTMTTTTIANRIRIEHQHQLLHARRLTHVIGAPIGATPAAAAATHGGRGLAPKSKQRSQIQFLLLSAFAYILSPIDIIPEAIFGIFGILDDIVFLMMCLFCVAIILLYPLFREMRRTLLERLGLKHCTEEFDNKNV